METTSVFRADFLNEVDAPAAAGDRERGLGCRGAARGIGAAGRQARPQCGFAVPAGPAHHVGGAASRQRHLSRRRHRQPPPRRVPAGERRLPGGRRRQPERHLCQPGAGRLLGAANGDEVQIGKFRLVFLTGPQAATATAAGRCRDRPETTGAALDAGMSIGAVLDLLRPDFPDVTISKIRFLEAEGLVTPGAHGLGLSQVLRRRCRAAAVRPDRAARPVPAVEGDQGAAGRSPTASCRPSRIRYGVPRLVPAPGEQDRRGRAVRSRPRAGGTAMAPAQVRLSREDRADPLQASTRNC